MLTSRVRKTLAAASVIAAASVLPVVTAAPAQATATQCLIYMHDKGYIVGPGVKRACGYGDWWEWGLCVGELVQLGVRQEHASAACNLA